MLKLGTQTGSLVNHVLSQKNGASPTVGIGATELRWSDRDALTVVDYDAKKGIVVMTYDKAENRGDWVNQDYEYTTDYFGSRVYAKKDKNGAWVQIRKNPETGRWVKGNARFAIGYRETYRDPSF